jgi:hypothetical protein
MAAGFLAHGSVGSACLPEDHVPPKRERVFSGVYAVPRRTQLRGQPEIGLCSLLTNAVAPPAGHIRQHPRVLQARRGKIRAAAMAA